MSQRMTPIDLIGYQLVDDDVVVVVDGVALEAFTIVAARSEGAPVMVLLYGCCLIF